MQQYMCNCDGAHTLTGKDLGLSAEPLLGCFSSTGAGSPPCTQTMKRCTLLLVIKEVCSYCNSVPYTKQALPDLFW